MSRPTNGFNIKTLPVRNIILSIKEIGGSERLLPYWEQYYDGKQALLFVVNAAGSPAELDQARQLLRQTLADARLRDRPCLLIGTHADRPDARGDQELEKLFQPAMAGRRWSVHCCNSFDRVQVTSTLDILIDMMLSAT